MHLSEDEKARIRRTVEAIDDAEPEGVLKGDVGEQSRFWAEDLIVNAPHNEVVHISDVRNRMINRTGLQYSLFERHREAIVVRRDCAVTMGYEVVVPKGNVPNSGQRVTRRYTNIYSLDQEGWRVIARQATNISVQ